MRCHCTLLKTSSKTVVSSKNLKCVEGTRHLADRGILEVEGKCPTGTRQLGGIEASFTQGEFIEPQGIQYF